MLNIAVLADGRVPAVTAATEVIDGLCKSSTKTGSMSESVNNVEPPGEKIVKNDGSRLFIGLSLTGSTHGRCDHGLQQ